MKHCKTNIHLDRRECVTANMSVVSAKEGHPTQFLKVLHYALFGASRAVCDYLYSNGVDRGVVHFNDLKFLKYCLYILVSTSFSHPRSLAKYRSPFTIGKHVRLPNEHQRGPVLQVWLRRGENAPRLRRDLPRQAQAEALESAEKSECEASG